MNAALDANPGIRRAWHPHPHQGVIRTARVNLRVLVGDERRVQITTGELIDI